MAAERRPVRITVEGLDELLAGFAERLVEALAQRLRIRRKR